MRCRFLSVLILVIATLAPLLAPPAAAQPYIIYYPSLEVGQAAPQTTYDALQGRVVVASIRQPSPLHPNLVLDLTVHPVLTQGPTTYVYSAAFLNLKYSDFEIVDVLGDGQGYVVFLNRLSTPTDTWSSWAVRVDAATFAVSWARQILPPTGEQGFLRVREAIRVKGGYTVLAALDGQEFDADTIVIRLNGSGDVAWAKSYQLPESVELFTLAANGLDLMAGGWISDFASDDVGNVALLRIDAFTGNLLDAATYDAWADFDLAMAFGKSAPGTQGRLYIAGKHGGYDAMFFPVDKYLTALLGTGIQIGSGSSVEDFLFLPSGDLLALTHSWGGSDKTLTVPGTIGGGTAAPFLTSVASSFTSGQVALTSVDAAGSAALVGGALTAAGTLTPGAPVVAMSDTSGTLDYCAAKQELPPRQAVEIATRHFYQFNQNAEAVVAMPYAFSLVAIGPIYEEHVCH